MQAVFIYTKLRNNTHEQNNLTIGNIELTTEQNQTQSLNTQGLIKVTRQLMRELINNRLYESNNKTMEIWNG